MLLLASFGTIVDMRPQEEKRFWPSNPRDRSGPTDVVRGPATNSMSAESPREFVDSNILVYAFDPSADDKQKAAQVVVARLWVSGTGCLSVQVLQEFFINVTKKVP